MNNQICSTVSKDFYKITYRILFVIVSGISVGLHASFNSVLFNAHKFSFYTVQSNIFCFLVMCVLLVMDLSNLDTSSKKVFYFKGMALSAITCTFLIYHFAQAINIYSLRKIGIIGIPMDDFFAHYLTPLLYVLDWLIFQPKGFFLWRNIVTWLAFPILYLFTFLTRCFCNSETAFIYVQKFPYYFLNYENLGVKGFLHYICLMAIIMVSVNSLIICIDKLLYLRRKKRGCSK